MTAHAILLLAILTVHPAVSHACRPTTRVRVYRVTRASRRLTDA